MKIFLLSLTGLSESMWDPYPQDNIYCDMRDIYGYPSGDDIRELNALGKDPDYDYKMFYIYNEISQDEDKYSQYVNGSTTMEERAYQLGYRLDGEP